MDNRISNPMERSQKKPNMKEAYKLKSKINSTSCKDCCGGK